MPSIPIYPPSPNRTLSSALSSSFPQTIQTLSGLALLEIQGTINTSPGSGEAAQSGENTIGKLIFPDPASDSKRVYMYVGKHQRLTGEIVKLKKAVAILGRRNGGGEGEGEALQVLEVVKWKVLFGGRPEPVGGVGGEGEGGG